MYDLQHNRYKLIQDAVAHACEFVEDDYSTEETADLLNYALHFMYTEIQAHAEELNGKSKSVWDGEENGKSLSDGLGNIIEELENLSKEFQEFK